jgi:hypothetical protein
MRHLNRFFARNSLHLIHNVKIENVRFEARSDPLYFVRPRLRRLSILYCGQDWRLRRLHRYAPQRFVSHLFDIAACTGNCPPGSDSRYEDVDLAVGVAPDLRAYRLEMNLRICRILKLLRDPVFFGACCRERMGPA